MYTFFIVATIVFSVAMIGIVLIQKSKGGGLSSQFSGGNQIFGVRGTNSGVEKGTWILAGLIFICSVFAAYAMPKEDYLGGEVRATKNMPAPAPTQQANAFQTQADDNAAAAPAAAPAQEAPAAPAAE